MSRIGRSPITVPAGVKVEIGAGNAVTVTGPKGSLSHTFPAMLTITQDGDIITVSRPDDSKQSKSLHGLSRSLLNNMVVGVKDGFTKSLELQGVGYRVAKVGENLTPETRRFRGKCGPRLLATESLFCELLAHEPIGPVASHADLVQADGDGHPAHLPAITKGDDVAERYITSQRSE